MALTSYNAPYVHSSIYRFNGQFGGSILDTRSDEGKKQLNAQIAELNNLKKILEDEANQFLGGADWRTILTDMGESEKKMREIATDILNTPETVAILSGSKNNYTGARLAKAFPQIASEIFTYVDKTVDLSTKEAVDLISKIILNSMPSSVNNFEAWKNIFVGKISDGKGEFEKKFTEQIKGKLTSEKGKIRKIVQQVLKSRTRSSSKEKTQFINFFETEFRRRARDELTFVEESDIENYLSMVIAEFRKLKSNVFTGEASSMLGKLGEDFLAITMNGTNTLTFYVTGMLSEEKMLKDKELSVLLNGTIKTHHKTSADSQTDLLITNNKTKKTIRAQSKNLQAAYQSVIDIERSSFPGMAKLQQETSYTGLIEQLRGTGTIHLSNGDLDNLSYLLANEIWFRANPSLGGSGKARGVSNSSSILGQTAQAVSRFFTQEITNFIGITVDNSITVHAEKANSYNSFYLISNKILYPTYLIIENLISQLKQETEKISRLQVTLDTSKSPGGAEAFYKSKIAAVAPEPLKADGNYSNGNLVAVGTNKGSEIISSLTIRNIGLQFNIEKLLETSYTF